MQRASRVSKDFRSLFRAFASTAIASPPQPRARRPSGPPHRLSWLADLVSTARRGKGMPNAQNKAAAAADGPGAAAASGAAAPPPAEGSSFGRSVRSALARLTPTNYNMVSVVMFNMACGALCRSRDAPSAAAAAPLHRIARSATLASTIPQLRSLLSAPTLNPCPHLTALPAAAVPHHQSRPGAPQRQRRLHRPHVSVRFFQVHHREGPKFDAAALCRHQPARPQPLRMRPLPAPHHPALPTHPPRTCRERLMPLRSWVQRSVPGMLALTRRGVEHPGVGVPGVCNFVDGAWAGGRLCV